MQRRANQLTVFHRLLAVLCGCLPLLAAAESTVTPPRPNIIFILTDDLGFGDLGVYYQNSRNFAVNRHLPAHQTPHLDTMASQGLRMNRHYTPAPVCAPARASLLTGMHQGHTEVRDNQFDEALEDNHTVATVLKEAGYATAAIGKWGLQGGSGFPGHPQNRGFDYFFGPLAHRDGHFHYPETNNRPYYDGFTDIHTQLDKSYSTDLTTARAKKWIADRHAADPTEPFFLYLSYTAPHARLEVPTQAYPSGRGLTGGLQWTGTPDAMINTASGTVDSFIHPDYASATWDHDENPSTAEQAWPNHAKRHATMVRRIDDAVDDLFGLLEDLELDENTLVVFTSDNGPHNEAGSGGSVTQDPRFFRTYGPLDGIKRDVWEGGVRVPALVRWPAGMGTPGRVIDTPSQFHDWLPTFAELAGVPVPARSDGVSLVSDLTGAGSREDSLVYSEYAYSSRSTPGYTDFDPSHRNAARGQMQVVYLDGYKGVRTNIDSHTTSFRVYETLGDPQEKTNLAGQFGVPTQAELQARVLQVRRAGGGVSRPYDSDPIPGVDITTQPGLAYAVYENAYPWVPTFENETPTATGITASPNVAVRTRDADIGLAFNGYLHVPTTGLYEFYVTTDTGAIVHLHDALLVDADFGYTGGSEQSSGAIPLEAGFHPIRIETRHLSGAPSLALAWSGPEISKQTIPVAAYHIEGPPGPPQAVDDQATTDRDEAVDIPVLANDTGGATGDLTLVSTDTVRGGTAVVLSDQVRFTPASGFLGNASFAYTISDGVDTSSAQVDVAVIYRDSMIWLPLNETSGLIAHESGGEALGQLEGYGIDGTWASGRYGQALDFNGSNQRIELTQYTGIVGTAARTVSAWIKTTGHGPIVAWGHMEEGRKWVLRIQDPDAGHVAHALRIEVEGGYAVATTPLADGQWHHVAAVLPAGAADVENVLLYADGALETISSLKSQSIDTSNAQAVWVGADMQNRWFDGLIDEVRIEPIARSTSEISALAASESQIAEAWHRRYFGAESMDWGRDDDGDGTSRLLEFSTGGAPYLPEPNQSPQWTLTEEKPLVKFRQAPEASETQWVFQVSGDLVRWEELPLNELSRQPSTVGDWEDVWAEAAEDQPAPPRFYRLRLLLP
tara:strand:+ start:24300 stop:27671 length:3372 start_codon:yes stop_codon:yes gene_type:complete